MTETRFGASWWGKRWIESLERLSTAWQSRLPRGRDYAEKGHVIAISVSSGRIDARVQGSRSKPYTTTIEMTPHRKDEWEGLVSVLAREARYAAELLGGEMPEDIEEEFRTQGMSLFPARNSELIANCSCPDKARPCKHIAAVHYAFGQALDRDPFLLFELRGADRDMLLDAFHHAWFPEATESDVDDTEVDPSNGIAIAPLSADRFNRSIDGTSDITISIREPEENLILLTRLQNPPAWDLPVKLVDLLGPVVEKASEMARGFALMSADIEQDDDTVLSEEELDLSPDEGEESPYNRFFEGMRPLEARKTEDGAVTLPSALPGADLLAGAIGVDQDAEARNQRAKVGKRKAAEAAPAPPAAGQPVVLRRRKAEPAIRRRPGADTAGDEAPAEAPQPVVRRRSAVADKSEPVTRRKGAAPQSAEPVTRRKAKAEESAAGEEKPAKAAEPAVRRRRKVVGDEGDARPARPLMTLDTMARAAWAEGDAEKTFEPSSEAWLTEPNDQRFLLMAAAAEQLDGVLKRFEPIADKVVEAARRQGRRVSTQQLLLLLTAGRYDAATEFMLGMDTEVWQGADPPGALYLSFVLMALIGERSIPENSNLSSLVDELFERGETAFSDLDDPPAPVGAWLEFTLADAPLADEHHAQLLQIARNMGLSLVEFARSRPIELRPPKVARLAVAVAEAMRLLADEEDYDSYTAMANARSAADPQLGRAVQQAMSDSSLMGYLGA